MIKIGKVSKVAAKSDKRGKRNPIQNLGEKKINQVICFCVSFSLNCEHFEVKYKDLFVFILSQRVLYLAHSSC